MSTESGVSTGVNFGPLYIEETSNGDYNLGLSLGLQVGEGLSGGASAYAEVTYNEKDGFSTGYGTCAEGGLQVGITPVRSASIGAYSTGYVCRDSRK